MNRKSIGILSMQGRIVAKIGLVLVLAGGIGLYFAYEAGHALAAAASWAAIVAGALALLGGIGRFMTTFMTPQRARESEYGEAEIRLLIQAMGAMAAADGRIGQEEVDAIARVYERMLGMKIEPARVRAILAEIDADFDIAARLRAERPNLSPQLRGLIVNCCYLVMMSDFVEDRKEQARIHEIGRALGFSDETVDDMVAAAGV